MTIEIRAAAVMALSIAVFGAIAAIAAGRASNDADCAIRRTAAELNDIGLEKMKEGDLTEAVVKFEEALAVDPSCMPATHNLGKVLAAARLYDRATSVLERGLASSPDDKGCVVQLAQIYALKGDGRGWRRWIEKAASLPESFVLRELPVLLLRQGSVEAARCAADMALDREKGNPVCWFNSGLVSDAEKNAPAAERCYAKAVEIKPDYLAAWVNLGNALAAQGEDAEATDAYKKAYECDPADSFAQYNYGRMLVLGGDDVAEGFHLLKVASEGGGGASRQAKDLVASLVALANEGGAK